MRHGVVILIMGISLLIPKLSQAYNVQDEFDRADSLRYSENYAASIPVYQNALVKCAPDSELFLKYTIRLGISYFLSGKSDKAMEQYTTVLNSSGVSFNPIYKAHALNNIGLLYDNWGNFSKSIEYYEDACKLYDSCDDQFMTNVTKMNIGVIHKKTGDFSSALKFLTEAALTFERNENHMQLAETYSSIAGIQQELGNLKKARLYFNKSLEIRKSIEDKAGAASTMNNLGSLLLRMNQPDSAMMFFSQSLLLMNKTSSLNKGIVLHNIGNCYVQLDDLKSARTSFKKSIRLKQELHDTNELIISLNSLAEVEVKLKQNKYAKTLLNSARNLFSDLTSPQIKLKHYQVWKELYKNIGDLDSAVYYLELATKVKNEIADELYLKELALLQEGYESKSKDQVIDTLKVSNSKKRIEVDELTKETESLKKNLFIIISGFVMVIAIVLFLYYAQKQQLKRQKLEAQLRGVELEKRRISMELHDAVGSDLKYIKQKLNYYSKSFSEVSSEILSALHEKLSTISEQITRISRELHHPTIDDVNFVEFIMDFLFDTFENAPEKLTIEINNNESINELPILVKEHLFRSLQEITSNIKQHSEASHVVFRAESSEDKIVFKVSDNGKGINSEGSKGIGLKNISDRMHSVSGELLIQKADPGGTEIFLKVPIKID